MHYLACLRQIVIDLCAAPGGWTQIASKVMPRDSQVVIAVDILPIRAINPNVITLIGDITTEKCRSSIRSEMQGAKADVVLCDGAPNIGSSYDRDAYQQNEIALHALKCATEHLKRDGSYVTKIYRSSDYSSYLWVVKQFFRSVQAVKPTASRSQSAEIFLVCEGYLDPTSIDPRMLDPKHVFEQVDGAATGGGDASAMAVAGTGRMNIFHKNYGQQKRHRQGYDMSLLDGAMRRIGSIANFIEGGSSDAVKDPVQMLSVCTGLAFSCHICKEEAGGDKNRGDLPECNCKFYLEHSLTNSEIKACVADLKVLNKADFKGLLLWRLKMIEAAKEQNIAGKESKGSDDEMAASGSDGEVDSETEEQQIQDEIEKLRQRKLRERKKLKKKERKLMAKKRQRAAYGMDLNAIEVPDNEKIFALATITSKGDLEAAREVDLAKVDVTEIFPTVDSDDDDIDDGIVRGEDGEIEAQGEMDDVDEDTGYSYRLDRELDAAYDSYLVETKNGLAKSGTKMAKRTKKLQRQKADEEAKQDEEMMLAGADGVDMDTKRYVKMLQATRDSDDSSSDEEENAKSDDDDGFHSVPMTPEEHKAAREKKGKRITAQTTGESNPLIHRLPAEPTSDKTARWFSNPLFDNIGLAAQTAAMSGVNETKAVANEADFDSDDDTEGNVQELGDSSDEEEQFRKKKKKGKKDKKEIRNESVDDDDDDDGDLTAENILALIPKTDKMKRHEKRKKAMEREERKKARRARIAGQVEGGFEVAPAEGSIANQDNNEKLAAMDETQRQKVIEARALIKAGMGQAQKDDSGSGFEVVSVTETRKASGPLPISDSRKYDSDNEEYDSDDYAQTLALGTMMLRKSKAKALVDASYNRYAWNDPEQLPEWFVDDENKHHRPQLPIPPELLAKMKEKFISLSTRPIAKVAEARARKNKRAKLKLAAAKKKAEALSNSSEMSEAMKLKAISKAMRGQDSKRPGRTYVVSKRGGGTKGAKGVKLVDKRMKNDKRSMDRSTKKRKSGKQNKMTGGKKRRNHK